MEDAKPKQSVKLSMVTSITLVDDADIKKYTKMKGKDSKETFLKITFLKEALIKGALTELDMDSEPEENEKDEKKNPELEWFFYIN